ncbi:MAG: hypothetical protein U1D99_06055, partial [Candidatus Omnitrophota bacterium]|nr:hypothetical protein [Candidatus Omnitrophota bacterium]
MRKSFLLLVAGISVLFVFSEVAQAQLINYNRRRGAGAARPAPAKPAPAAAASTDEAEKPAPFWAQTAPAVTNAVEKKYDVNRDGKLQPAEVKIYLRDV